jgi:hypothetical protein
LVGETERSVERKERRCLRGQPIHGFVGPSRKPPDASPTGDPTDTGVFPSFPLGIRLESAWDPLGFESRRRDQIISPIRTTCTMHAVWIYKWYIWVEPRELEPGMNLSAHSLPARRPGVHCARTGIDEAKPSRRG